MIYHQCATDGMQLQTSACAVESMHKACTSRLCEPSSRVRSMEFEDGILQLEPCTDGSL